jgi:hypothetical protein
MLCCYDFFFQKEVSVKLMNISKKVDMSKRKKGSSNSEQTWGNNSNTLLLM